MLSNIPSDLIIINRNIVPVFRMHRNTVYIQYQVDSKLLPFPVLLQTAAASSTWEEIKKLDDNCMQNIEPSVLLLLLPYLHIFYRCIKPAFFSGNIKCHN